MRVRECVMCFVSACEGDERERTGERGSKRNIFSTVGGRTREGVRAVLRCQHRAAGTGSHPLHFDAAHWGTHNNFGLQKENGSSFLWPPSLSLPLSSTSLCFLGLHDRRYLTALSLHDYLSLLCLRTMTLCSAHV